MPITSPSPDGKPVDNSVSDNFIAVAPLEFLAHQDLQRVLHEELSSSSAAENGAEETKSVSPAEKDFDSAAEGGDNAQVKKAAPSESITDGTENSAVSPSEAEISDLVPLSVSRSSAPFSFAPSFAANANKVPTLDSGIIEDMGGGLFKIAERINAELAERPDEDFQNLVDGVLRKR